MRKYSYISFWGLGELWLRQLTGKNVCRGYFMLYHILLTANLCKQLESQNMGLPNLLPVPNYPALPIKC